MLQREPDNLGTVQACENRVIDSYLTVGDNTDIKKNNLCANVLSPGLWECPGAGLVGKFVGWHKTVSVAGVMMITEIRVYSQQNIASSASDADVSINFTPEPPDPDPALSG